MTDLRLGDRELDDRELAALAEQLMPHIAARMSRTAPAAAPRLFAAGEVATRCGWPSRKAMEMAFVRARKRGELHELERMAVRVEGSGRRWLESDVAKWIEAQR